MSFLSIFSSGEKTPDLIKALELENWYLDLSKDEKDKLYENSKAVGPEGEYNLLDQKVTSTSKTSQNYLQGVGESALSDKDYDFGEKVLLKALNVKDSNPVDRHFVYNKLIKLYYKQRENEQALKECKKFCQKDIESIDKFLEAWEGQKPRIPSFKRLAIIYEKEQKYRKAIEICEKAIEKGLEENTQSGFEGRKKRLEKKLD